MGADETREDIERFAQVVLERYDVSSVVDIGCGRGQYIERFHDAGVDVLGVERSTYALDNPIDEDLDIRQHDLTEPFHLDDEADIDLCIEVLEHLPPEAAPTAARTIAAAAPVAIVTAAASGQGGKHHVNEQPLDYWIDLFTGVGMVFDASATDEIREAMAGSNLAWLNENLASYLAMRGLNCSSTTVYRSMRRRTLSASLRRIGCRSHHAFRSSNQRRS